MTWIWVAITSYFFTAIANILDKMLLTRFLKAASIYAFYVGILSIVAVVLIPFGVVVPSSTQLALSLLFGAGFIVALMFMYNGFLRGETTRVATLIGGSLPIYTVILSFLFLGERLAINQLWAFIFLIAGMFVITFEAIQLSFKKERTNSYIRLALLSGLVFSITFVGSKYVFDSQGFISGFFWMRIGSFVAAASLLLIPLYRKQIANDFKAPKKEQTKSKSMVLANQIIGAIGFLLLNYAISLGSVTIINAMQGLQYIFIFFLAAIIGHWVKEVKEPTNSRVIFEKTLAIIFIATGLLFLAF